MESALAELSLIQVAALHLETAEAAGEVLDRLAFVDADVRQVDDFMRPLSVHHADLGELEFGRLLQDVVDRVLSGGRLLVGLERRRLGVRIRACGEELWDILRVFRQRFWDLDFSRPLDFSGLSLRSGFHDHLLILDWWQLTCPLSS